MPAPFATPQTTFTRSRAFPTAATALGVCALALATGLSLSVGAQSVPVTHVGAALIDPDGSRDAIIVWQLRAPRTAFSILVGMLLAIAGAIMQGVTRNPLAEPGLLGVNAGASLAVVSAITLTGAGTAAGYVGFAIAGSLAAALIVVLIGFRSGTGTSSTRLLLAGVALSASLMSITGMITLSEPDTFGDYRAWIIGSVASRDPGSLLWLTPVTIAVVGAAALLLGPLAILALGDDVAASLGSQPMRVRLVGVAVVTVACGAATAVAGPISFVGLVVPHAARLIVGHRPAPVFALSLIGGPALMLTADVLGRIIAPPGELEVGIVTAFVGAPVLVTLVLRPGARHPLASTASPPTHRAPQ